MKYLLLIPAFLILYIAFAYGRILYFVHYSPNPKITQLDKTLGSGPVLKYIAAGDSTAVGEGSSSVEKTYPYKIAEHLSKTNTVQYKNIAVRGAKTSDVIANQLSQITAYQPDVVTISIGANDATHLLSQQTILNNYKQIISELTQKTHAQIYVTNIANFTGAQLLPYPYIKLIESRSDKINPQINTLATDRIKIINIHDFGWDRYPDRQVTYSLDHFHPSDTGYENWTNAFLDQMPK